MLFCVFIIIDLQVNRYVDSLSRHSAAPTVFFSDEYSGKIFHGALFWLVALLVAGLLFYAP